MEPSKPQDPRNGFTSASAAQYDRDCPGRHLAQRAFPTDTESKDARTGTLIHQVFSGDLTPLDTLDKTSRKTLSQAWNIEYAIISDWLRARGIPVDNEIVFARARRELRLWLYIDNEPRHSGQADAFWLNDDMTEAIIEDLKSLWGDTPDSTKNMQLRDLAVMLWLNFGVTKVSAFINQPNAVWRPEDVIVTTYEEIDLVLAHKEMIERIRASNSPESKRVTGPQCRFCRAAGTSRCPESQMEIANVAKASFDADSATPERRSDWIDMLKRVEKTTKKSLSEMKELVRKNGESWAGWKVSEGGSVRSIKEPSAIPQIGGIMSELYGSEFTPLMLAETMTVSVPQLQELHAKLSGLTGRAAFDEFTNLFGEFIETKEKDGSLVKLK